MIVDEITSQLICFLALRRASAWYFLIHKAKCAIDQEGQAGDRFLFCPEQEEA